MAFTRLVALLLIPCLIATGCGPTMRDPHGVGGGMVQEFRPEWEPRIKPAPFSAQYVLWGWDVIPLATTGPASRPVPRLPGQPWERPRQISTAYIDRGQPIGFVRSEGRLIAVAGNTTVPVSVGHYCWHMNEKNDSQESIDRRNRIESFRRIVAGVTIVALLIAGGILYGFAESRPHS